MCADGSMFTDLLPDFLFSKQSTFSSTRYGVFLFPMLWTSMDLRFAQHVGFFSELCYHLPYFWSDLVSSGTCVTTALPYANGDLHLGHILEQTFGADF